MSIGHTFINFEDRYFLLCFLIIIAIHYCILSDQALLNNQTAATNQESVTKEKKHKYQRIISVNLNSGLDEKPLENSFLSDRNNKSRNQKVSRVPRIDFTEFADVSAKTLQKTSKQAIKSISELAVLKPKDKQMIRNTDPIDDVPLGDITSLNTTEFRNFGFYNRIKGQIEQFWGASVQNIFNSQNSRSPAEIGTNYITALTVVLNDQGKITKVFLRNKSGVKELDRAAVDSFNKAGPFPNPPKDMIEDGKVIINWEFVVDT